MFKLYTRLFCAKLGFLDTSRRPSTDGRRDTRKPTDFCWFSSSGVEDGAYRENPPERKAGRRSCSY